METKPYQVGATPILFDGERFEPGAVVELTDKEAAGLAGHVSPAPAEDESKTTKKGGKA